MSVPVAYYIILVYTSIMNTALFWNKVTKTNSCWFWTGATTDGYGKWTNEGRTHNAHKLAYELLESVVPDGLELDHLCRNRHCVNPEHLEMVTHETNTRRGDLIKHGLTKASKYKAKKYLLYIHDERFRQERHKSGLVNELLAKHYDGPLNTQIQRVHEILDAPNDKVDYESLGYVYDPLAGAIYDPNGEQVPGRADKKTNKIIELL